MPSIGSTIQRRLPLAGRPELLAEHAVVGPLDREPLADRGLDRPVGLGHRRQVGLRLDDAGRSRGSGRARSRRPRRRARGRVQGRGSSEPRPYRSTAYFEEATSRNFGVRDRQLQRLRPAHELMARRQSAVDAADPVPPVAGLEGQRGGGASVDGDPLDGAPRVARRRPLDLVGVRAGSGQPGDEGLPVEGLEPAEAIRRPRRREARRVGRALAGDDGRRRLAEARARVRRRRRPAAARRRSTGSSMIFPSASIFGTSLTGTTVQ